MNNSAARQRQAIMTWLQQQSELIGSFEHGDKETLPSTLGLWRLDSDELRHLYLFISRQQLVNQVQELMFKLPEIGLRPEVVPTLSIEYLIGMKAFLSRTYDEKEP